MILNQQTNNLLSIEQEVRKICLDNNGECYIFSVYDMGNILSSQIAMKKPGKDMKKIQTGISYEDLKGLPYFTIQSDDSVRTESDVAAKTFNMFKEKSINFENFIFPDSLT